MNQCTKIIKGGYFGQVESHSDVKLFGPLLGRMQKGHFLLEKMPLLFIIDRLTFLPIVADGKKMHKAGRRFFVFSFHKTGVILLQNPLTR